jgi:N-acylneuraminate cytidylyltransferase/CMP-N,N'-diacetyllegionaminic acid synthase
MLRTRQDIEASIEKLRASDADVCVTAYHADHNPYYNMVEVNEQGLARVCIAVPTPIVNRQQAPDVYNLSPAIFAIRRRALWAKEHWSQCRMTLSVIPRERAVDIDTEFDLALVESLVERQGLLR